MARPHVAAFDVDGTITTTDCVVPFARSVAGTGGLALGLARQPTTILRALSSRDRDALKLAGAVAAFAGRTPDELATVAEPFVDRVVAQRLRPDVGERLAAHLAAGDTVVFVSASFEVYLVPLATRLGVDHVLGTKLAVGDDGLLTGRLDGANCRGPEKVRRLHEWLRSTHGGRDAVHLSAYGDSTGDRELLADADTPHWVGRSAMPRPSR